MAMRMFGTMLLALALAGAPACGGGSESDSGGSPSGFAASFAPAQPTPGSNTIAMLQGARTNDLVTVNVTATDTGNLFGIAFDVLYDDTKVTYTGFAKGTLLEQGSGAPNYTVDGSNLGRIVVGVARTNGTTTNASGTKTIIALTFRVKNTGTFPLNFVAASAFDGQNPPHVLILTWFGGALQGA